MTLRLFLDEMLERIHIPGVMTIDRAGSIELDDKAVTHPEEAAQAFWDAVRKAAPPGFFVKG